MKRFVIAQNEVYKQVIKELKRGCKVTHWMWFIFPQLDSLGYSDISYYYGIHSIRELYEYVNHPILSKRLKQCFTILLNLKTDDAIEIFGVIDAQKLQSCATLFRRTIKFRKLATSILNKYYDGYEDEQTVYLFSLM